MTTITNDAIKRFLARPKARMWSPRTSESYRWAFGYLNTTAWPDTETLELLLGLAADRLGPTSLRDVWRRWRAFFRWADRTLGVANPLERIDHTGQVTWLLDPPATPDSLPRILSRAQLHDLLDRGCKSRRDRLMVLVCLDMGLRLSEVASLSKPALSPDGVRITGKGRKTRIVPISQDLLTELLFCGSPDHLWLGHRHRPLSRDGVKTAFRRIFHRAGIPAGPHSLRHTFATEYLRRGGDLYRLSRILGHSDVRTTEIYLHLVSADLVEDHRRVSPVREWIAPMRNLL